MSIPFSLPLLNDDVVNEVVDALTNTGWITSGPKVQQLEKAIRDYVEARSTVAVSSWTSGAMVTLRWLGVGPGDEVIVPAYTYCATALAVLNVGATPVMVDIESPFHISPESIAAAITPRTKAIIPVDLGGLPCDYRAIREVVESDLVRTQFKPSNRVQENLGRPMVIADAAHSLGGAYGDAKIGGGAADAAIFSFHSVKNLTTGEGGMICLNLPDGFDHEEETRRIKYLSLNGQTKTALDKSTVGGWKYDIVDQGFKANMPDLCAAVGLAQMRIYASEMLPERRRIFDFYNSRLENHAWALRPTTEINERKSSLHLYQLRIEGIGEEQRNAMMRGIADAGVGVNVHYVPMPMLTLFRRLGYAIEEFPSSFAAYQNEITLPVYNGLTDEQLNRVIQSVEHAHSKVAATIV